VFALAAVVLVVISGALAPLAAGALGGWLRGRPAFMRRQRYLTGGIHLGLAAVATFAGGERRRS
jgi:hypothetical protein